MTDTNDPSSVSFPVSVPHGPTGTPPCCRPVSATCHRRACGATRRGKPPVNGQKPSARAFPGALLSNVRNPVPRSRRFCPESRCRRCLRARLSSSTAPPSCCSTCSAARPGGGTWSPAGRERAAPTSDQILTAIGINRNEGACLTLIPGQLSRTLVSPHYLNALFRCRQKTLDPSR